MKEAYAEIAGARIWVRDSGGSGAPVVFMHAGTGSSLVWEHQLAAFTGAGHRFIAYDRLGHGRSENRRSRPGAAADDLELLANSLELERFHLVGTAAGGIVSLDYALSYPQRLLSLVIANSIGGMQDEDYLALQRRLRPAPQFSALPPELRELGPAYRAANPAGEARWIELEHRSRAQYPLPEPQVTRNKLTFAALEKLSVPTLLLTGDADLYTPAPVLELFAKRIRNSKAVVLAGVGHSAFWEQPQAFNRAVLDFIKQVSAGAASSGSRSGPRIRSAPPKSRRRARA